MLIRKIAFLMLLSCSVMVARQEPYVKHSIAKGETVYSIARKYKVTPYDIYQLNPDAKDGIKENAILLIPSKSSVTVTKEVKAVTPETETNDKSETTTHVVKTKETLYGLAKQYDVSVADLKEWNPEVAQNGLKVGQEIIVSKNYQPDNTNDTVEITTTKNTTEVFTHVVKTKETLYGISKQYDLSISELEELNPQLKESGLQIGDTLQLKKVIQEKSNNINGNVITSSIGVLERYYIVKPEETLFSISRKLSVSEEELLKLNPEAVDGVKTGMKLKLPNTFVSKSKPQADLIQTLDFSTRKDLVLLLPFNVTKIYTDTSRTVQENIKENKFLNLTLDFYSGALMAIDSAKVMGLPVHVKILDVESSRSTSNIAKIIGRNDFSDVDAVIGPFQNSHVEATAQLLSQYNTPVISPLSKEESKPLPNLYSVVPLQETMYKAVFNYMYAKNGNVLAVVSKKKNSTKEYLEQHYKDVKFASYNAEGAIDLESIRTKLVKSQKNFVILESELASQVLNVTNALVKYKKDFDIQLVVLELYDTLDYDEIPMQNLVDLNLLFPSSRREIDTPEGLIYEEKYEKKYGVKPNSRANAGFDITFDTLLRICQPESFEETAKRYKSEQIETAFDYESHNGVIVNDAVYIQYYSSDYTIKPAL
ncbi:LysM peptidoglycan-binding domain-containing protein [Flavobacterium sp. NRK F10]|uniref:PBP1 and LysM peptidoglycan-binding domain-containing protein n=1 Tax=Flavobacterium sp. NRK F10 TaxID=2954931 RepID=UPI002091CF35|nr:LysM peptidoglycan-binding domain-containing protein [Flavobacterium sp. NRK F10]MCO6175613.1 LysM peptidoglycan-binding domain-containing protein [Flavobacterium sp. NRK F10]